MKTIQKEAVKSTVFGYLPEAVASIALFAFSCACGAASFIGTILSAAVLTIAAVSIDFSKYEKGGEQ